jgi:hypothetical protein
VYVKQYPLAEKTATHNTNKRTTQAVVVKTPYSPVGNVALVIRVNIIDRSTKAFVLEYSNPRMNVLWECLLIRRNILQNNPLLLLSIVFEEYGYSTEAFREELDRDVARIEQQSGHTSLTFRLFQDNKDYEDLTKDLHSCTTSLIFMENIAEFERDWGVFCKETLDIFEALRIERGLDALTKRERVQAAQNMDYHLNLSQMRRSQALSLQKRAQLQINVVSKTRYSQISSNKT